MKKKSLISICVVSVFLLSGLVVFADEFGKKPFQREIIRLRAIAWNVNSVQLRTRQVEKWALTPDDNAVGRFNALDNRLWFSNIMMNYILEGFMGVEPTPIPASSSF